MRKNSPVKGHHGLGARGQGKLLYYHTQIPQTAARQAKDQPAGKRQQPHDHRQPNGRWAP
ncbi:hypothetical protein [Streptomyces sp. HG99]|uniref:Integrase n=1 Tax=Streptomyces dengpaensis TaxID=2049881 RepID=A0ABN5I1G2_9ACTN|nr:hypothetical protein [Streptomyces sp. HG99]AVH57192.1 hypothetical protein C4B68_16950 [Streptomyces dengpaensis]PIB08906.1 hypothetical protein B1C81_11565 [Streptomyces sp. HG99]